MNPFLRHVLQNAAGSEGGAGGGGAAGTGAGGGAAGAAGAGAGAGGGAAGAAGAGDAGKGDTGKGDASKGAAPESYTFAKLKTTTKGTDGKDVVTEADVDAGLAKEISEYAKTNGLTQAQAQALMDRELKLIADAEVADKKAQAEGLASLKKQWQDQARADKEFGGEGGAKFDENLSIAKRALTKFFPEVSKEADKHPFLDHPQVLKGLLQIGKLISPDGEFVAGRGTDTPRDIANVMYPNMA